MNRRVFLALLIAVLHCYVEGLTIFCSRKLHLGDNYDILITNNQPEFKDKVLRLQLVADEPYETVYNWANKVNSGETPISINMKNRDVAQNYTLTAYVAGSDFNQSIEIITISNDHPIQIQTTKNFYHSGEELSFQVITLDQKMKLYQPKKLRVKVVDTLGRSIYEQSNLQTRIVDNVFAEQLSIPFSTAAGALKIQAFVTHKRKEVLRGEKEIKILDEAVPDLNVYANVKQSNEQLITVEVYAVHSFGPKAKGKVDVSAWVEGESSKKTKSASVEDSEKFSFDLNLTTKNAFMMFEIKFEEALTGQKVIKTIRSEVCSVNCHELDVIAPRLIPGFLLTFQVKLSKFGSIGLIKTNKVPVAIKMQYISNCSKFSEEFFDVEIENNEATFSKDIPQNVSEVIIEASYLEARKMRSFKASSSASKASLKLSLLTDRPVVGEKIKIKVDSTKTLFNTHLVVSQASKVLLNDSFYEILSNEDEIEFMATSVMRPFIDVTYFYYVGTGETIYDKIRVDLHESFELSVTPSELEPGQNVTIVVQGQPNSIVTLMATIEDQEHTRNSLKEANRQKTTDFLSLEVTSLKTCSLRVKRDTDDINEVDQENNEEEEETETISTEDLSRIWHLETIRTDENGFYTANKTVPSTIATWSVSGFSIAPSYGKLSNSVQVKVFKKFFIKTVVPNSVRLGEIAKISVIVYMEAEDEETESTVEVEMSKVEGEDFEFVYVNEKCEKALYTQLGKTHHVTLSKKSPFDGATFFIRPLKSGKIRMAFRAVAEGADSVDLETFINVKHFEISKQKSSSTEFDLRAKKPKTSRLSFEGLVFGALEGTTLVRGSLAGKMFSSDFFDVSSLINKQKTSSNEQVTVMESIIAMTTLKYLSEVGQISSQNLGESNKFILDGYQRLLERKKSDGSFGFVGYGTLKQVNLTAQVVKCIDEIRHLTTVDTAIMKNAFEFLRKQQIIDRNNEKFGSFIEREYEQGNELMLTAFVAISLMENSKYREEFEEVSQNAVEYLSQRVIHVRESYDTAVIAYVMALAQDENVTSFFTNLITQVTNFDELNSSTEKNVKNLAAAAFTVLACLKAGKSEDSIKPMLWILDRVHGFDILDLKKHLAVITQAMVKFSEVFYSHKTSMKVTISEDSVTHEMSIGSANSGGVQTFNPSPNVLNFGVKIEGEGFAILESVIKYKVAIPNVKEKFAISMEVETPTDDELTLKISISVKDEEAEEAFTGISMEVEFPYGYVFDTNSREALQEETSSKKIQALDDNRVLIIHYKSLTRESIPSTIKAIRKQKAEGRNAASERRSAVRVYDDKENYAVEYYTLNGSQYCDVTDESS